MACFLLHTSHILSNIYNSANFPDQSKHLQTIGKPTSAHLWSCTVENGDRRNNYRMLTLKIYMLVYFQVCVSWACVCLGSHRVCLWWMEEVYCGTVAQIKRKKEVRTNQHTNLHGSTGCRHRFSCHLLRRQGWAHLSHISPKQMFNICAT